MKKDDEQTGDMTVQGVVYLTQFDDRVPHYHADGRRYTNDELRGVLYPASSRVPVPARMFSDDELSEALRQSIVNAAERKAVPAPPKQDGHWPDGLRLAVIRATQRGMPAVLGALPV